MGKRKPRPGACGICGAPVVEPDAERVHAAFYGYQARSDRHWIDGHLYEMDDATGKPRLKKVRCGRHAVENDFDPRTFGPGEWF